MAIDLPSHFVMQYIIGCLALTGLAAAVAARPWVFLMLVVSLGLNLWQVAPYAYRTLPELAADSTAAPSEGRLKLLHANTLYLNHDTKPFEELIAAENPDIVIVQELNTDFAAMLAGLKNAYPYQSLHPLDNMPRGLGVISRRPLHDKQLFYLDKISIPAQSFAVMMDGKRVDILSMHPATPVKDMASRDREFSAAAKWVARQNNKRTMIVGDMNATAFCPALKKLAQDAHLSFARKDTGFNASYTTTLPAFTRIPIDHVMTSDSLKTLDFRTTHDINSDHLPIVAVVEVE